MSDTAPNSILAQVCRALAGPERAALPLAIRRGPFDVVAIAASAGGLDALTRVLAPLPAEFPAAVVVVQHVGRHSPGMLAGILNGRTRLRVQEAVHGAPLAAGTVSVAPSDRHLRVSEGKTLRLSDEAPVHFARPAADPLFQSVAAVFGKRALGVVLTGGGEDGAAGVQAIKARGGVVLGQHPDSCYQSQMPRAAVRTGCVDLVLALEALAPALVTLVMVPGALQFFGLPHPPPLPFR